MTCPIACQLLGVSIVRVEVLAGLSMYVYVHEYGEFEGLIQINNLSVHYIAV